MNFEAKIKKLGNMEQGALDRVIDSKGNIVLHVFGDTALLMDPSDPDAPYVVAYGYDKESGKWAQQSHHDDLSRAWQEANPKIIEDACVTWELEDVAECLENHGVRLTDDNVSKVIQNQNVTEFLKTDCVATGVEDICNAIEECLREGSIKKDSLIRGVFDDEL